MVPSHLSGDDLFITSLGPKDKRLAVKLGSAACTGIHGAKRENVKIKFHSSFFHYFGQIPNDFFPPDAGIRSISTLSQTKPFKQNLCFFRVCLPPAVATPMFCEYLFAYFADICVILCLCAAVCGRQFLSRVDHLIQFHGVF